MTSATTMRRLGVITTSYPRWAGDAAGNFVGGHVAALRRMGFAVDVLAAGDGPGRIASPLFYRGGAPDLLARHAAQLLEGARFTARLALAATRLRVDALVAHWLAPSAIAALPARVPLLAIAHGGDVHTLRRTRLLVPLLHLLMLRRARLAFVSHDLFAIARDAAPRLRGWLDDAAIVQPMGVELDRFAAIATARTTRPPAHEPTILIAARLVALKGVDVAIDALAHLRTRARLVIAGDGPDATALARRARASIAAARIALVGQVDTARRDALLHDADLVIVPSRVVAHGRTEGTPLIALEALAAGLPVIASAVGGLRELAPRVDLVVPDDPRALASAIDHRLAFTSPPPVVADLGWSHVAERLCTHAQVRMG